MSERILNRDDFAAALNSHFTVHRVGGEPVELVLVQVSELQPTAHQEMFSILFHGPLHTMLSQGTYSLSHAQLGTLDLFIVPVGKNERGFEYQAVFNRLRK